MNAKDVKIGKKVIYHPIIGGREGKEATITSEVYEICCTLCCKIDIIAGVVAIDALDEV